MIEMAIIAGLFGLLAGSFLNVCVGRLPQDLSVAVPRSYCPRCGAAIASWDNIPVLSYLVLRGRCRYCRIPISARYPVVELATGILFFLAVWSHGWSWAGLKLCVFSALLVGLMATDIEERILPDEFTKPGMLLGLFLSPVAILPAALIALLFPSLSPAAWSFLDSLAGALLVPGGLWFIGWAYQKIRGREGLGFGDVKLMMMTGAFLGLQNNVLVLIVGAVLGAVIGLGWILWHRKDPATYELPFGLFLGMAALGVAFVAP